MSGESETFLIAETTSAEADRCFEEVKRFILRRLPSAEVEHVGSTAVPGCIGKGDVDVAIRVSAGHFASARSTLDQSLVPSWRNEVSDGYAEYDYQREGRAASVHLVTKDQKHDVMFCRFKALLLGDPTLLDAYNSLKWENAGRDMEEYRVAKAEFIESALARDSG